MPNSKGHPTPSDRDERFVLPLDPETALRGLLAVDPDDDEQLPERDKSKKNR